MSTTQPPSQTVQDSTTSTSDAEDAGDAGDNTGTGGMPPVGPLPSDKSAVREADHPGGEPVIPCELDEADVPLRGGEPATASPALPATESGQLHMLMCHVLEELRERGEDIDHELLDRWREEARHPLDLAAGPRDHELGALALGRVAASAVSDDEQARDVRVAERADREPAPGQETLAAFGGEQR